MALAILQEWGWTSSRCCKLAAVIELYDIGGRVRRPSLSADIVPLGLTDGEKRDLVAFLESLTSPEVGALVADAFAAPIGERR